MTVNDDYLQKQQFANQLIGSNCGTTFGFHPSYSPPELYSAKRLTIDAVEGGYVIAGRFHGKGDVRTVAVSSRGLTAILKEWAAQLQADA